MLGLLPRGNCCRFWTVDSFSIVLAAFLFFAWKITSHVWDFISRISYLDDRSFSIRLVSSRTIPEKNIVKNRWYRYASRRIEIGNLENLVARLQNTFSTSLSFHISPIVSHVSLTSTLLLLLPFFVSLSSLRIIAENIADDYTTNIITSDYLYSNGNFSRVYEINE